MIFSSANSTKYLVYTVDGMMPLKGLNSVDVRLLLDRFYILVIIASFALTSGSSEVSLERDSHDLHDSNSLKGPMESPQALSGTSTLQRDSTYLSPFHDMAQNMDSDGIDILARERVSHNILSSLA
ncbi:hypothetical protein Tco_0557000 [Tanacetum coccineum]